MESNIAPASARSGARLQRTALLSLAIATSGAWGTPAPADDPLGRLLAERGLVTAATGQFAGRERNGASEMVVAALNFLDVPYRWGGSSASEGFDCSGFTRYIFKMGLGWALPRRSDEQARQAGLIEVAQSALEPGDLVFFNTLRRAFSHVGIYVGDGKFIHAPREGAEVRLEDMRSRYWARRYDGARRAPDPAAPPAATPVEAARTAQPAALDTR